MMPETEGTALFELHLIQNRPVPEEIQEAASEIARKASEDITALLQSNRILIEAHRRDLLNEALEEGEELAAEAAGEEVSLSDDHPLAGLLKALQETFGGAENVKIRKLGEFPVSNAPVADHDALLPVSFDGPSIDNEYNIWANGLMLQMIADDHFDNGNIQAGNMIFKDTYDGGKTVVLPLRLRDEDRQDRMQKTDFRFEFILELGRGVTIRKWYNTISECKKDISETLTDLGFGRHAQQG